MARKKKPARPKSPKAVSNEVPARKSTAGLDTLKRFAPLILAVVIFLTFVPILTNDFVNIDDPKFITENPQIQSLDGDHVQKLMKRHWGTPWYKPLSYLSWAVEYQLFGFDPAFFHLDNLILHIINSILVFFVALFLVRRIFKESNAHVWMAVFIAAVFALHPMKVESVAWAVERKDVLFSLFFFSSLLCYLHWTDKKKVLFLVVGGILFALGLLAKSMILSLPFILFAIDYLLNRKWSVGLIAEKTPWLLGLVFALIAYGIVLDQERNKEILGLKGGLKVMESSAFDPNEKIWINRTNTIAYRLITWPRRLAAPYDLSIVYPQPSFMKANTFAGPQMVYLGLLIIFIGLAIYAYKYSRLIPFAAGWFFLSVLPVLPMEGHETTLVNDRYTYIASFAFGLLLTAAGYYLLRKKPALKALVTALAIVYPLILAALCFSEARAWKNSQTLWTHVIERHPTATTPWINRGTYLDEKENYVGAIADYSRAIEINNSLFVPRYNRGSTRMKVNDFAGSLEDMKIAVALKPDYGPAWQKLAESKQKLKDLDGALKDFNKALTLQPEEARIYLHRGTVYYDLNDFQTAVSDYDEAIRINPEYKTAYYNRGNANIQLKAYRKALQDYSKAIELDPSYVKAFVNRGLAKENLQQTVEALKDYELATSLDPGFHHAWYKLGLLRLRNQDNAGGCEALRKAAELGSSSAAGYLDQYCGPA